MAQGVDANSTMTDHDKTIADIYSRVYAAEVSRGSSRTADEKALQAVRDLAKLMDSLHRDSRSWERYTRLV